MLCPRAVDFDAQWMARRGVAGVAGTAIAARTTGQRRQQIDLGEQFDEIPRPRRARLHEVLVRVAGVAGTHEDIDHVVHVRFGLGERQASCRGQGPSEIRMAAIMVVAARQQKVRVGVAAGADDVMHAGAELVDAVPVQGVVGEGRHRAQPWKGAPQPVTGADVGGVQGTGLAAVEPLAEVGGVPQVQVADLRAFDGDDAKQMSGRDLECPCIARRHGQRLHQGEIASDRLVERPIERWKSVQGVDRHGFDRPPGCRVGRFGILRCNCHGLLRLLDVAQGATWESSATT